MILEHPNCIVKKVKADIALPGNPISELQDVTCLMGSHSVTCDPTWHKWMHPVKPQQCRL